MSYKARRGGTNWEYLCVNGGRLFAAVVIGKEDSHVNISLSSKHVSQLCPSAGHLPEAVHIVSDPLPNILHVEITPLLFVSGILGGRKTRFHQARLALPGDIDERP